MEALAEPRVSPGGQATVKRGRRRSVRGPGLYLGLAVLLMLSASALLAQVLAPHDPGRQSLSRSLLPPIWQSGGNPSYPLGTDSLGRDLLSRLIYGARVSVLVALSTVFVSGAIGIAAGVVAGYYSGAIDALIMRLTEVQLAFPFILMALLIISVFGGGLVTMIVVLSLSGWGAYARVARAEVLATRERDYVQAARAAGAGDARIMLRHVLPNIAAPLVVVATFSAALFLIQESALSFLGIGVPPNVPSWGGMLADGRSYLTSAWWLATIPGLAIVATVLGLNLLGDWLRDTFDPQLRF